MKFRKQRWVPILKLKILQITSHFFQKLLSLRDVFKIRDLKKGLYLHFGEMKTEVYLNSNLIISNSRFYDALTFHL